MSLVVFRRMLPENSRLYLFFGCKQVPLLVHTAFQDKTQFCVPNFISEVPPKKPAKDAKLPKSGILHTAITLRSWGTLRLILIVILGPKHIQKQRKYVNV
jgi:hypothetical protein